MIKMAVLLVYGNKKFNHFVQRLYMYLLTPRCAIVPWATCYFSSGYCVTAYWEIAAHSAYDVYLIVILVFSHLGFGVGISF